MSKSVPFPDKKYSVILADPPWNFRAWSQKGIERSAENHYDTMSIKKICALPVADIADKNCILLIWATMPMLREALEVIEAWGFKYKTVGFTWMKQNPKAPQLFTDREDIFAGMGYWTRSNCELCLLATRGKPRRSHADVRQAILSPLREHSRKPYQIYDRIERLVHGPYIELFARTQREGWDIWGNQSNKFDIQ